ncbi:hypothetical protein, partial [Mesorhizobium sp.]|uniref:hypothetical protein n=1 Tax=Mesorhizobium sp. TaxID=1871066 RepID=UPI0025F4BFC0
PLNSPASASLRERPPVEQEHSEDDNTEAVRFIMSAWFCAAQGRIGAGRISAALILRRKPMLTLLEYCSA